MASEAAPALINEADPEASVRVRHVGIIMDGNGRWARARGMERRDGHREGVEAARRAVEAARDLGIYCLTLYSFSTENWRRPAGEVRDLMNLLREFIGRDLPRLKEGGVRIKIIGDRRNLDLELRALVVQAEKQTASNEKFLLQIAFNYGGRDEIVRAAAKLVEAARKGNLVEGDVTEEALSKSLDTADAPDPDMIIRTSGEKRVSNFLLWQGAYAEYIFLDVLWPDFTIDHLQSSIVEFQNRHRRFGGRDTLSPHGNAPGAS